MTAAAIYTVLFGAGLGVSCALLFVLTVRLMERGERRRQQAFIPHNEDVADGVAEVDDLMVKAMKGRAS